ncbi:hypothetical protein ACIQM4_34455 [Streptomyces sp. NPDC091272]|uniref:hypothetical protein n=1 Tax=Streptomyces sp. NPDC091272 TaxID=3365981 RepID=UPI00381BE316
MDRIYGAIICAHQDPPNDVTARAAIARAESAGRQAEAARKAAEAIRSAAQGGGQR